MALACKIATLSLYRTRLIIHDHTSSCFGEEISTFPDQERTMHSGKTYLILVCGPHLLDNLLGLGLRDAALAGEDLGKVGIDLASHVGSVTAYIKVGFLL